MNNKSPADIRMQTSAILAINSLDRYSKGSGFTSPSLSGTALISQFNGTGQPCNNFTIYSAGALIYGYIKKIQVSQIQIQYNIPTVIPDRNDIIFFTFIGITYSFAIPYGYYTPEELAAVLEEQIQNATPTGGGVVNPNLAAFTVVYEALTGFIFKTNNIYQFAFLNIEEWLDIPNINENDISTFLRAYRLLGIDKSNSVLRTEQQSSNTPIFLYTPYIDIISQNLTKYQKVKDTDSSPQKQADIISRIYLAGTGGPQITAGDINVYPLGSRPFTVVQDMNYCKTMRWSKDEAVNSLDFQLKDQYGELIFQNSPELIDEYYTEFQMTLLCIEEQD